MTTHWIAPLAVICVWLLAVFIVGSRIYFLQPYGVVGVLPAALEPFGMTAAALPVCLAVAALWAWLASHAAVSKRAMIYALVASMPIIPWLPKLLNLPSIQPLFVEAIWLAAWTGLSFRSLLARGNIDATLAQTWSTRPLVATSVFWAAIVVCAAWWFCQLRWYQDSFLLGYNDYGHFLQRLSNTLAGQGLLIETPMLPRFWDHFNPGLLILLPAWYAWPDVTQSFVWQSLSLSMSGYLVYRIAVTLGHSRFNSSLFGLAWLAQPAAGQMNLGFSYGWHPITLAIPLLLGTIWTLLLGRRRLALGLSLLALSMEEGVFVIVALTATCCAVYQLLRRSRSKVSDNMATPKPTLEFYETLSTVAWLTIAFAATVCFVLIYRFSGLAEFQTGRFVALGNNTTEIVLSPFLRPRVFWGALMSTDRWLYLLLLWLPCGLPALRRGWRYLVPTFLPLLVLMVWGHPPAICIAFQYASTLLPLFWLAALTGAGRADAQGGDSALQCAATALVTGIVLSMYLGQLPFSSWTLLDVDSQTYGAQDGPRRRAYAEDGIWLAEQIQKIRAERPRCLATGRIAAHLVGMPDIETVGQYVERRQRLSKLEGRSIPLRHYDWIILDRIESFQQTPAQVKAVEEEARANGFVEVTSKYEIVVLRRRD